MVIDVEAPVVKTYGVPPAIGVAVIRKRGFVADAAIAWIMTAFGTGSTSAIAGSSASTVNVAGMIVPWLAVRAVRNMFAWKPGGRLVVFQPTSIQLIVGVVTVMARDPVTVMPLSIDVAVIVTGLGLAATPVTRPVASTVATVLSLDDQLVVAVVTVWPFASCGVAESCVVPPTKVFAEPAMVTWSRSPTGSAPGQTWSGDALFRGAGAPVEKSTDRSFVYAQPASSRIAAVELVSAAVVFAPQSLAVVLKLTASTTPAGHAPESAVVEDASATLPAVPLIAIVPIASGVGSATVPPVPCDSWTR